MDLLRGFLRNFHKPKPPTIKKNHKKYLEHKEESRKIILERVNYFSPICGVSLKRIAIRNQKSRWGSCSSKGNLNFNYRLAFLPKEVCDYVIVHELCHLKELNHGPNFWSEVEKILPDYQNQVNELRLIERRLRLERFDIHTKYGTSYFSDVFSQVQS